MQSSAVVVFPHSYLDIYFFCRSTKASLVSLPLRRWLPKALSSSAWQVQEQLFWPLQVAVVNALTFVLKAVSKRFLVRMNGAVFCRVSRNPTPSRNPRPYLMLLDNILLESTVVAKFRLIIGTSLVDEVI